MRLLFTLAMLLAALPALALQNQLKGHPSPYLAMHGDDPVHWQAWGPAVLEQAAAQGKLILISSGYFSCHWCHVMQRESYRDPAVAARLNAGFIAVKLDRELHPALDAHLIDFVERTQGAAGWPLNVFLTPEGYPLVGLTYAPRDNFLELLERIQDLWEAEPARARLLAERAMAEIVRQRAELHVAAPKAPADLLATLRQEALAQADELGGGFGEQSRFPMAPQLLALLQAQQRQPDDRLRAFLVTTLDHMASEGLRDHLAGGFFRYTVDPGWQVPHYEKMLYTQAQLARVYLHAGRLFGRADYLAVARDTLDFTLNEMAGPDGAFIASLSAVDAAGEEGGPYLWSQAQLQSLLSAEQLPLARAHWRLTGAPASEGGHLPLAGSSIETLAGPGDPDHVRALLADARKRLLTARAARGLPRDGKQLAGWNGLMLIALTEGAKLLDEPRYRTAAERLKAFLSGRLWDGRRLARALDGERPIGQAGLEDYAYVAAGLAAAGDQAMSRQLQLAAWDRFHDGTGWRRTAEGLLPGMAVEPALMDDTLPSPSAWLIDLARTSADAELRKRAGAAAASAKGLAGLSPFWYAGHALLLSDLSAVAHADAVLQ